MGYSQDSEKQPRDQSVARPIQMLHQGRAGVILGVIAVALSVAALTVILVHVARENHHREHSQYRPNDGSLQASEAPSGRTAQASGDADTRRSQLEHAIEKRQARTQSPGSCHAAHWRQVCRTPALEHRHHSVGARVTMSTDTDYRTDAGLLRWEYKADDCVAMCMGLDHSSNTSMLISEDGIYNIRIELRSKDHFADQLAIELMVNNTTRLALKWFPNTPLANVDGNIEHSQLVAKPQPHGVRVPHIQTPQAKVLTKHQLKSLEIPIMLERLAHLRAGSRLSVRVLALIVVDKEKTTRPLVLDKSDSSNNYFQVFRA